VKLSPWQMVSIRKFRFFPKPWVLGSDKENFGSSDLVWLLEGSLILKT